MHCPDDWYQTFFRGIALEAWRNFVTPPVTAAEADAIQRYLGVEPPARLLDVPCGNGRLAIELASRGFSTVGVDLAAESIVEGQGEAAIRGVDVELRHGDMRDLGELGTFDGLFCWGNSFGYLEEEGNVAFLLAASTALTPGARLVLQFGTLAETILPTMQHRTWYQVGDLFVALENAYDITRSRLVTQCTFAREGMPIETRTSTQQVYTIRELRQLLIAVGFDAIETYSADGTPLHLGGQGAIVVARKAG